MRCRGDMIAHYTVKRGYWIKVHYEHETRYFTVYTYEPNAGWLHHYQCKDFLKAAASVDNWIKELQT